MEKNDLLNGVAELIIIISYLLMIYIDVLLLLLTIISIVSNVIINPIFNDYNTFFFKLKIVLRKYFKQALLKLST